MTFKRAIPPCTPSQQARQDQARGMGCIVCRMIDAEFECGAPTIHHLNPGGRTISQDFSVCLGKWHHEAHPLPGYGRRDMDHQFGPALPYGSKPFHDRYGSNDALLAYQNELLGIPMPPMPEKRRKGRTATPEKLLR